MQTPESDLAAYKALSPTVVRQELQEEPAFALLREGEDVPFKSTWEAEAFAIANLLIKADYVSREEWMNRMNQAILKAQAEGDPDRGDTYFNHWMDALEGLLIDRGEFTAEDHHEQLRLWSLAVKNTPHGVAISLEYAQEGEGHSHSHDHEPHVMRLEPLSTLTEDLDID